MPGARVVLRDFLHNDVVVAETTTGADGRWKLDNPPVGEFKIYVLAPSSEYSDSLGVNVKIDVGQAVEVGRIKVFWNIHLLTPANGTTVNSASPELSWGKFADGVTYGVSVKNVAKQGWLNFSANDSLSFRIPEGRLTPGATYLWQVLGSVPGNTIARSDTWTFSVQP